MNTMHGLPILLISPLATRFHRDIFHGVMAFGRQQHPHWRISCHTNVNAIDYNVLRPAGVLLTSGDPTMEQYARRAGVSYVLAGYTYPSADAVSVSTDEDALGEVAAEYLAGLGLRNFAYVGHGDWPFVHARCRAFVNTIGRLGYGPVTQLIGSLYDKRRRRGFLNRLRAMLQALPRPCGLLAANDDLGATIVRTCINADLRVPDDIAILGVDDDEVACEMSEVPLSSIAQPLHAIGYEAARLLQQQIERPGRTPNSLRLPPIRVIARSSSDLINLDDADVVAAIRLINAHYAEPINVEWIVGQLPVARRSLERKFKSMTGRTLLGQIHQVRLQKAQELLAESDLSLELVAQRSGFANARWLADNFRRQLNTTPTRFRQKFRTIA